MSLNRSQKIDMETKNIHPIFEKTLQRSDREKLLNQKGIMIWFTGLSGSGKSTLAIALEKALFERGYLSQILDGDNIRTGINNNLGFSEEDRMENIRRIAEISKLFINCGIVTIAAFISPTNEIRNLAKSIIGEEDFIEIYVSTPIEECERRDIKGLYAKARRGEIKDFTGISAPFEPPIDPTIDIDTTGKPIEESVEIMLSAVLPRIEF